MRVYRDKLGRFATKEKAYAYQEVFKREYEPIVYFREKEKEYEEYEYFIGADYDTPKNKPIHDVHIEFKITSPYPLGTHEIENILNSKLKEDKNSKTLAGEMELEIKSEEHRTVSHQTTLHVSSLKYGKKR